MSTTTSSRLRRTVTFIALLFAVTIFSFAHPQYAHAQVVSDISTVNPDAEVATAPTPTVDPTQAQTDLGTVNEGSTPASSSANVTPPAGPTGPKGPTANAATGSISLNIGGGKPSQSILIIILVTLLSIAPALLVMMTSFTRIIIVLSLTRNALGVQTVPPSQVLIGLALFLSLFIMGPTFSKINHDAVQPYLKGQITQTVAFNKGTGPLKTFMLAHTRKEELSMFISASGSAKPATPQAVSLSALVPAFIISELKTAFIIGFVIFIPFLVIDLIVSSSLMSMGMMMLPPILVSLPFKLLLFVLVDGWGLVVKSLITSFRV